MKKALVLLLVGGGVLCAVPPVGGAFLPYGPQNDVALDTVLNDWGWSIAYRGHYGDSVSLDTMFGGATGEYIMLAGINNATNTIDVLAAALKTDVLTYTAYNTTHAANGSEWYCNEYSLGFAGLGDTIRQYSADVYDAWDVGVPERDRLSWHASGDYESIPTYINGGWRSGTNTGLNYSTDWDRLVLTSNVVPLPAGVLLGILGLGVAQWRLRKRA